MGIVLNYLPEAYAPALRRALMAVVLRANPDCGRVVEHYLDCVVLPELQRLARLPDSELAARVKALDADVQSK